MARTKKRKAPAKKRKGQTRAKEEKEEISVDEAGC